MHLSFETTKVADFRETTADLMSKLEVIVVEETKIEIREDIDVQSIEVNIQSAGVDED